MKSGKIPYLSSLLLNILLWIPGIFIALLNHQLLNQPMILIQWLVLILLFGTLITFYYTGRSNKKDKSRYKHILVIINLFTALFFVWVSLFLGDYFFYTGFVLFLPVFYFVVYFYKLPIRDILIYGLSALVLLVLSLPVSLFLFQKSVNSILLITYLFLILSFIVVALLILAERTMFYKQQNHLNPSKENFQSDKIRIQEGVNPSFYYHLNDLFLKMVSPSILENYPDMIYQLLGLTGRYCHADRAYIFHFSKDRKYLINTYEWCCQGIDSQITNLQHLPVADYPWWLNQLNKKEIIYFQSLNELPVEAIHEKEILEMQDITGDLVAGIYRNEKMIGFVGLDYVKGNNQLETAYIPVIKLIAGMLSCLYNRLQMTFAIYSEDENGFTLPESQTFNQEILARNFYSAVMKTPILVVDHRLRIITMNLKTREDFYIANHLNPDKEVKGFLFISENERPVFIKNLKKAISSDEILSVISDKSFRIGDAYYAVYYFKILDDSGESKALILYFIEMTAQYINRLHLIKSLEEKEFLLSEIHHRVKNNMQIMANLMDLKAMMINEQNALSVFYDTRDRLKSLALLHEKLYESQDLGKVKLHTYLKELADNIIFAFSGDKNISFDMIKTEPVEVTFDKAITLGMLMNEIIVNSMKHGFHNKNEGHITLGLSQEDDQLILEIEDNGSGFDVTSVSKDTHTLGLNLISGFIRELNGSYELHSDAGTYYKIRIPYI
jgi:two-component sensor histidine kinase